MRSSDFKNWKISIGWMKSCLLSVGDFDSCDGEGLQERVYVARVLGTSQQSKEEDQNGKARESEVC